MHTIYETSTHHYINIACAHMHKFSYTLFELDV